MEVCKNECVESGRTSNVGKGELELRKSELGEMNLLGTKEPFVFTEAIAERNNGVVVLRLDLLPRDALAIWREH